MAKWTRTVAVLCAILLLAPSSDQPITRGYVYSGIGSTFAWSGSAQGWSGSPVVLTCGDWTTYIRNDGTACSPAALTVLYSYATAHAIVTVTHSPLLANNTFTGGNFASWTATSTGGCVGYTWSGQNASDQDGDIGYALASSGSCTSGTTLKMAQTFTVGTSPTSQTFSFWYLAPSVSYGDGDNCTQGFGSGTLTVTVNATTVATPTITFDGAWHQVSGTMSALTTGSNTITFSASLAAASGQASHYNYQKQMYVCSATATRSQTLAIDKVVLSAVY